MRTLRVKLTAPETGPRQAAQAVFDEVSELHSDQAVFQVNRTRYVDADDWGFRITYRSNEAFVRTTSLAELEDAMARVAANAFERRVTKGER